VWRESRHVGSLAEGSRLSGSRCTRGGCSSLSSIEPTRTASHGRRNFDSPRISGSHGRRCSSRSVACSRLVRSSNTSRVGQVVRLGIGSVMSNLPDSRAGWSLSTCPIHGAGWRWVTCPGDGHEVVTSHVSRSAAVPPSAPLRGEPSPAEPARTIDSHLQIEAEREHVAYARWSPLRPLPRPLADDEELTTGRGDRRARVIEVTRRGGRRPAEPQTRVGVAA
jgi:hypothetical protein